MPVLDCVSAAKAGDSRAFEALLDPVLEPAFRLAMVMLRDRPAAEDALQEAALKAWRHLGRFRPDTEFRPWFLAIVANECRSARRSRRPLLPLDLLLPRAVAAPDAEGRIDLAAGLERLHRRHLLPLTLYYHLDLPIAEVARSLGCSENAARVRIHRALRALHPLLALQPDGEAMKR